MVPYVFIAVFCFKCFKYEPKPVREMEMHTILMHWDEVMGFWESYFFYFETDASIHFNFLRRYEPLLESYYPRTWRDSVFCVEELHRPAGRLTDQWFPRLGKLLSSPLCQYGQGDGLESKQFSECILSGPVCRFFNFRLVVISVVNLCVCVFQSVENIAGFCKDLKDSGLHSSPLQFTLQCALEAKKTSE